MAGALKTTLDDVPVKVESLQDEVTSLKKELADLRTKQAMSSMSDQLSKIQLVKDVNVLVVEIPNANVDTLEKLK